MRYIKDQYAAKHRLVDNANALLEKQAAELRRQVRAGEERMSSYRAEHALSQGMHAGTDTEEITHLTEDLVKAQSERAAANARLDAARGKAGAEAQAAVAPSVVQLRGTAGAACRADAGAAGPPGQRSSRGRRASIASTPMGSAR